MTSINRLLSTFFLILLVSSGYGQTNQLKGKILDGTAKSDSVYLRPDVTIPDRYYESTTESAKISGDSFVFENSLTYPHLFSSYLSEDKGILSFRMGFFFVDSSSSQLAFNYQNGEQGYVVGKTGDEYRNNFQPFLKSSFKGYEGQNFFYHVSTDNSLKVDSVYLEYIKSNPDSYVALWHVIQRFFYFGHNEQREAALNLFSPRVKQSKIWKLIADDIRHALIKENEPFPDIKLKDLELKTRKVEIPKNKVVLVDFWFSNCIPCLDAFPKLVELYDTYKDKGFEIVGISIDPTKKIEDWKSVIQEQNLSWQHYLDEGGVETTSKMNIKLFPTAVLIDKKGKIVNKKISLDDLETYLKKELE